LATRVFFRFMKFLIVLVLLIAAAVSATWVRYNSFDPCVWMEQDMISDSSLPALIVTARIRSAFLLDGVAKPTPKQCLYAWWQHRFEDAMASGQISPVTEKPDKK
jgi:hypothetical protein